ncbi:hypothetical protein ACPPVO_16485 [Dactylosporangium sp. McL0621]|uniref:hypothetical protein n=1 Tax=Dactylosporangium sp. McL0621 TaxID=3415678 RepID=UPI003CF65178
MLTELDAVDWPDLSHAYGEADDVPDLLRRLATGDAEALHALYGNIWHQGTVYEATAPAVPFLIEVLDAPEADTAGVLHLLASIARGSSYLDVHERLLPAAEQGTAEVTAQIARELAWVTAAHIAVAAGRPAYLRLLSAGAAEDTRATAAYVLAAVDDAADTAALRDCATADPSPVVRAAAILALNGGGVTDARFLADPAPLPRVTAAMAHIVRESPAPVRPELAAVLAADAPAALPDVARLPWDVDDPLAWVLSAAERDWPAQVHILAAWLEHPDALVRAGAAYAAEEPMRTWRAAAPALAPLLAARLDDPDATVRYWAASHLAAAGRMGNPPVADALWAVASRGPGLDATAARALTALVSLQDTRADAFIARVLAAPAVPSLSELSGSERLSALTAATNERNPAVGWRRAVREQLGSATAPVTALVFDLKALQPALPRLGPWATRTRAGLVAAIGRARPGFEQNLLIATAARLLAAAAPLADHAAPVADHAAPADSGPTPLSDHAALADAGPTSPADHAARVSDHAAPADSGPTPLSNHDAPADAGPTSPADHASPADVSPTLLSDHAAPADAGPTPVADHAALAGAGPTPPADHASPAGASPTPVSELAASPSHTPGLVVSPSQSPGLDALPDSDDRVALGAAGPARSGGDSAGSSPGAGPAAGLAGPGELAALVSVLRGCLGPEHPSTAAIEALGSLGPAGAGAVPELAALLEHAEPTVRLPAAAAYARLTGDPAPLLAAAEAALDAPRAWQRTEALHALPAAGRAASALAPRLLAMFTDEDEWQSMRAAIAYWHATADPAPVVPLLLQHATNSPRGLEAVRGLATIGPAAAAALPLLEAAIAAPDRQPHSDDSWGHDDDVWLDACTAAVASIGAAPR